LTYTLDVVTVYQLGKPGKGMRSVFSKNMDGTSRARWQHLAVTVGLFFLSITLLWQFLWKYRKQTLFSNMSSRLGKEFLFQKARVTLLGKRARATGQEIFKYCVYFYLKDRVFAQQKEGNPPSITQKLFLKPFNLQHSLMSSLFIYSL
jgi:hypothetical protein